MSDAITGEAYEEGDPASSYHWASQSEVFSVLHVAPAHCLAVAVAPLATDCGVLAFPAGPLGEMEEQLARGTEKLCDMLGWTAPSEVVCEVVFMGLLDEQWCSVTSMLASPANAVEFHEDGRMALGPDLFSRVMEDWRFGNLDDLGSLSQDPEGGRIATSEAPTRSFPMPNARAKESPIVAKRERRAGTRGRAKRRPSSPSGRDDLRSLLTTFTERIEAME